MAKKILRLSLSAKAFLFSSAVTVVFFMLFALFQYYWEREEEEQSLRLQMNRQADILAKTLAYPLWNSDIAQVKSIARAASAHADVHHLTIRDLHSSLIARAGKPETNAAYLTLKRSIPSPNANKESIGTLSLVVSSERVEQQLSEMIRRVALAAFLFLALQQAFLLLALRLLLRPLRSITRTMRSLALGETDLEIPSQQREDEIGQMARAIAVFKKTALHNHRLEQSRNEAEIATRMKSEFLANMSHEIRTPMNAIIGMTSLLVESNLNPQDQQRVDAIRQSGEALLEIINDILDISKIEAGKMDISPIPFNLRQAVTEVTDLLIHRCHEKHIDLILHYASHTPSLVVGDPGRIRQILLNLIGNAVKFTERGSVTVTIEADEITATTASFSFSISDTGIGISPEAQARLFQNFTQGDASTTRKYGGTGLGLAICKRLVEAMDGQIGLNSTPGEGSTFWFRLTLPLGQEEKTVTLPPPQIQEQTTAEISVLENKHILVAEDNSVNQMMLLQMLKLLGCHADIAVDGRQAVALHQQHPYDLILMDCMMPEMNGYEATAAIRSDKVRGALPIIALTANALQGDREKCLEAGMNDYLSKPIKKQDLQVMLMKWLA